MPESECIRMLFCCVCVGVGGGILKNSHNLFIILIFRDPTTAKTIFYFWFYKSDFFFFEISVKWMKFQRLSTYFVLISARLTVSLLSYLNKATGGNLYFVLDILTIKKFCIDLYVCSTVCLCSLIRQIRIGIRTQHP